MIKPQHLQPGDTVMTVSSSWGWPGAIPHRYEAGKTQLEKGFGVTVIESEYCMSEPKFIYEHPELRAHDLMNAFLDTNIRGIISTIGGQDSIRILPYINFDIIKNNPKVFIGYSDTTISHFICQKAGIVSFYGPSIMSGFAENGGLFEYMKQSVNQTIFNNQIVGELCQNIEGRTDEFLPRDKIENQNIKRKLKKCTGRRWLQGKGIHEGQLIGGCIDVFPFMVGTSIRPTLDEWKGKVLFIETSEEKISYVGFERILRNLGSQGILQVLSGILVGRAPSRDGSEDADSYDNSLIKIITKELGLEELFNRNKYGFLTHGSNVRIAAMIEM